MSKLSESVTTNFENLLRSSMYNPDVNLMLLKRILRDTGSIIAGGSVLSRCSNHKYGLFNTNDIDIYTSVEKSKPLLEFLFGKRPSYRYAQRAKFSSYCPSFFTRNGIRCIYENNPESRSLSPVFSTDIDVMTIRNKSDPINVAKNFDLSFCQVWYDGESVYSNHPEDINKMSGKLTESYVKDFLNGNHFLEMRYDKYMKRGFTIVIDYPDEHTFEEDKCIFPARFKKMTPEMIEKSFPDDASKKRFVNKILFKIMLKQKNLKDDSGYDSDDIDIDDFSTEDYTKARQEFYTGIDKSVYAANRPNSLLLKNWMKKYTNF